MPTMPPAQTANPARRAQAAGAGVPPPTAPQQARSRATEQRLLEGAIELLREGGLEACSAPALAQRAGVGVGTIYRRFPDKDSLVRAACLRWLDANGACNEHVRALSAKPAASLAEALADFVRGFVESFDVEPLLLGAIFTFSRQHTDSDFRARLQASSQQQLTDFADALAERHAGAIQHRDPQRAARFAVLGIAATLQSLLLAGNGSLFSPRMAPDELIDRIAHVAHAGLITPPSRVGTGRRLGRPAARGAPARSGRR